VAFGSSGVDKIKIKAHSKIKIVSWLEAQKLSKAFHLSRFKLCSIDSSLQLLTDFKRETSKLIFNLFVLLFFRNPSLDGKSITIQPKQPESSHKAFSHPFEGIHWPQYKADNPIYFTFNAEGEEDMRADKYGRGPAATSCAFWNDFLPRLRNWGESGARYFDDSSSIEVRFLQPKSRHKFHFLRLLIALIQRCAIREPATNY
jgi:hypothetical protein